MAVRIAEMLRGVFGKPAVVFRTETGYGANATCFVISSGDRVEDALAADPRLAQFVRKTARALDSGRIPITTDDWPYLYQQGRWIPRTYYSVGLLVLVIAAGLYSQITAAARRLPSLFFFALGAGVLLLETQLVFRLALFFGTVWQVNGIVILALILALLLANILVEHGKDFVLRPWIFGGLLASLAVAYLIPFDRIPVSASVEGIIAAAVFAMPVVCAGLLFALEFQTVDSPSAALGANMLGAVAGGVPGNLSLVVGGRGFLLGAVGADLPGCDWALRALAAAAFLVRRARQPPPKT